MLIAIEGIDGAGKTTLAKALIDDLACSCFPARYLKFPDRETATGKIIDQLLRHPGHFPPLAFQALQVCNRIEHYPMLSEAMLHDTYHVVCDRYQESGLVYGMHDGLSRTVLARLSCALPSADVHILVRVDPRTVDDERLAGREREAYEQGGIVRLADLDQRFADLWREHQDQPTWPVVDGNQSSSEVLADTLHILKGLGIHGETTV